MRRSGVPASSAALSVSISGSSLVLLFSRVSRSRRFSMMIRSARFISSSRLRASASGVGGSPAGSGKPRTTWQRASISRIAASVSASRPFRFAPDAAATSEKMISAYVDFFG